MKSIRGGHSQFRGRHFFGSNGLALDVEAVGVTQTGEGRITSADGNFTNSGYCAQPLHEHWLGRHSVSPG